MTTKNDPIRVLVTWTIKPGQSDVFLSHAKALNEEMKVREPGARALGFYVGQDGKTARVFEEYADSRAVMTHLSSPAVGAFMPKFMACADIVGVEVLGDADQTVNDAYKAFGASFARTKVAFTR